MSTSASQRRRVRKLSVGAALKRLTNKNNFVYLETLPKVSEDDIYVDCNRYKLKDGTIVRKDEFENAINDSDCGKQHRLPLELLCIISDFGYVIPELEDVVGTLLPKVRETVLDSDSTLIKLGEATGLDIMQHWIALDTMHSEEDLLRHRSKTFTRMESTMNKVITTLRENCWTTQIYYQTKKYDKKHVISVIFTGVTSPRMKNYLYIFRVYTWRYNAVQHENWAIQRSGKETIHDTLLINLISDDSDSH